MASERLGERLVSAGVITDLQWQEAVRREGGGRAPALVHLARMGVPGEELAAGLGIPVVTPEELDYLAPEIIHGISADLARAHWALPVRQTRGQLSVAMADPFDEHALEEISFFIGAAVEALAIDPMRLMDLLDANFEVRQSRPLGARAMTMPVPKPPADDPVPASLRGEYSDEVVSPASGEIAALFGKEEPIDLMTKKAASRHAGILPPPPAADAEFVAGGELLGGSGPDDDRPTADALPAVADPERTTADGMPPVPSAAERVTADELPPVDPEDERITADGLPAVDAAPERITATGLDPVPAAPKRTTAEGMPPVPSPKAPPPPGLVPAAPILGNRLPALEPTPEQAASALQRVREAESRDRICEAALQYLALYFPRVAMFKVRGDAIVGWSSGGEIHHSTLSGIDVPVEAATFHRVIHARTVHVGPLPEAAHRLVLWEALDDRPPTVAGIVPVEIKDRVVTLLYGDSPDDRPVVATTELLAELAAEAGEGFRRVILMSKLGPS